MKKRILIGCLAVLFGLAGCNQEAPSSSSLQVPPDLEDGLQIGFPQDSGFNSDNLLTLVEEIQDGRYREVHSLLIFRNGRLVVEEYFPGYDYDWEGANFHGPLVEWSPTERHNIHSVGKSITSACVGIAIEKGLIDSVQDPIYHYLPDHQHLAGEGKGSITIEHLLTMTSGLEWNEWRASYASGENDVIRLWLECPDPVACILEKPLIHQPGSTFNYSGGDMILLGEIIKNASGMDIEAFSWKHLFEPLGIAEPPWSWINADVVYAGGDQLLTSREMLKFGILYLNGGSWEGQQILSKDWIDQSSVAFGNNTRINVPGVGGGGKGYGYTWWTDEIRVGGQTISLYYALGFGDQRIYVLPDQDAVVVFTSGNYVTVDPSLGILRDEIIPAMVELR